MIRNKYIIDINHNLSEIVRLDLILKESLSK